MNLKQRHLHALTAHKGTTGGSGIVRLADGTVEHRFWIHEPGKPRRYHTFTRVPIEGLTYQVCCFNEDALIHPDRPEIGSYIWYGLTYVCDINRHLVCWPYSKENLHLMAERLELKRCWFHKTHYDMPLRRGMLNQVCVIVPTRQIVKIIRGNIGAIASDVATSWQTLVASCAAQGVTTS